MIERFAINVTEWNAKKEKYEVNYKAIFGKYEDAKTYFDGLKINEDISEKALMKQTINWFGCVTKEEMLAFVY